MQKIGILGCGYMGDMHSQCFELLPAADVTAVTDVSRKKAEGILDRHNAEFYPSPEELIDGADVDVIDVCLPTHMHSEYVVRAARGGMDVICEKPISHRVEDAEKMVAEVRKTDAKMMVAQVIRFWPEFQRLKETIDSGVLEVDGKEVEVGPLQSLTLDRISPRRPVGTSYRDWILDVERSGSAALDLHIHDADFVRYAVGEPADVDSLVLMSEGNPEHIFTYYLFDGAPAVVCESGWDLPENYPFSHGYTAQFEGGTLQYWLRYDPPLMFYNGRGEEGQAVEAESPDLPEAEVGEGTNISGMEGYFNELQYWIDCLENDREPDRASPEEALQSLKLAVKELNTARRVERG